MATDDISLSIAEILGVDTEVSGEDGTYVLGDCFFSGVTGDAFRCVHKESGTPMAIKVGKLAPDGATDGRYEREIAFMRSARHPNIVRLIDEVLTSDGCPGWVFEMGEAETLQTLIVSAGRLTPDAVRRVGLQLARALKHLHDLGLVHRDLTPGHVIWEGRSERKAAVEPRAQI